MGITLYFSTHEAEAITPRLKELYEAAGVVVLEQDYAEDDDLNLNLVNELSRGNILIDDVLKVTSGRTGQLFPDFTSGLLSMIYRSGKPILLERSPFNVFEAAGYYALLRQEFRDMPLGKACRLLAENLAKQAAILKKRDEALSQQLADVVAQNPSSNIFVIRGYGHRQSLENALAARNVAVTSVTSHKLMLVLFTQELIQKIMAGGRPTRRELLRSLVEQVETRTTLYRPTQVNFGIIRDSVGAMSELQCEKFLKKKLNLT